MSRPALVSLLPLAVAACGTFLQIDDRYIVPDEDTTDAAVRPVRPDASVAPPPPQDASEASSADASASMADGATQGGLGDGSVLDAFGGRDADREGGSTVVPKVTRVLGPLADFNGDKRADYAEHIPSTGAFRIFVNNGHGGFVEGGGGTTCTREATSSAACDVMVGDFTGDGFADYADHDPSTGSFRIHANRHDGTFDSAVWGSGVTCVTDTSAPEPLSPCEVIVADFTGDGFVDYGDREPSSGNIYIHENRKNGSFAGAGINWGVAYGGGLKDGLDVDSLLADFTGDGFADYADHRTVTGAFFIHENYRDGSFAPLGVNWGVGHTCASAPDAPCDVLVGDFNGDGRADFSRRSPTSGIVVVHINTGHPAGASEPDVSEDTDPTWATFTTCREPDCEILGHRVTR